MRFISIVLCLVLALSVPSGVGSAGFSSTIQLAANPEAISADGKSIATVSAEVRGSSGNLVPDGTQVNFTTSLGTIDSSVGTVAGVARVTLRSDTTTGTALVSATLAGGGAVAQRKIEFLPPGAVAKGRSYVTITSKKYLIYSVDKRTVESIGGVKVMYRGTTVEAESAQLNLDKMELKARQKTGGAPIKITRNGKTFEASLLSYELQTGKGVLMTTTEVGAKRQTFNTATMQAEEDTSEDAGGDFFAFADLSSTVVLVKAKSITIREEQDIQFRRAEVFVGEKKVLSIPLHVMPLGQGNAVTGQMFSVSNDGLRVDVPLYYSLTPSFAGSFRIRNHQTGGWGYYGASPGWFLDLEQQYSAGLTGQGTLALTRVSESDWGARWTHSQDFNSGSQIYTYLDFPAHRDLFGMTSFTKPLNGFNIGINVSGNRYQDQPSTMSSDVYVQTNVKPVITGRMNYSVSARTTYASGLTDGSKFGNGLKLHLYGVPIKLGQGTSLSSSLAVGQDWGGRYSGQSLHGTTSLTQQFGTLGGLGLIYTYGKTPGITSARQRLSGNMFFTPSSRLRLNMFTTYGLDDSSVSSFGDIAYRFNGGWSLNALSTYQRFNDVGFTDFEFALGKAIGNQDILLVWSNSQKKFRLEFGALKF